MNYRNSVRHRNLSSTGFSQVTDTKTAGQSYNKPNRGIETRFLYGYVRSLNVLMSISQIHFVYKPTAKFLKKNGNTILFYTHKNIIIFFTFISVICIQNLSAIFEKNESAMSQLECLYQNSALSICNFIYFEQYVFITRNLNVDRVGKCFFTNP